MRHGSFDRMAHAADQSDVFQNTIDALCSLFRVQVVVRHLADCFGILRRVVEKRLVPLDTEIKHFITVEEEWIRDIWHITIGMLPQHPIHPFGTGAGGAQVQKIG